MLNPEVSSAFAEYLAAASAWLRALQEYRTTTIPEDAGYEERYAGWERVRTFHKQAYEAWSQYRNCLFDCCPDQYKILYPDDDSYRISSYKMGI